MTVRPRRFSDEELMELLRSGKSMTEAAEVLGVNVSSVSRRKSRIDEAVAKDVSLFSASKIVDSIVGHLGRVAALSDKTQELLDLITFVVNAESEFTDEYREVRRRLNRVVGDKVALSRFYVELQAELRQQVRFYFDVATSITNMKKVQHYQEVVFEAIREADPETAQRIINKLAEVEMVYGALAFGQPKNPAAVGHG